MGRIIAPTKMANGFDEGKSIECGLLVDTGVGALILPRAWKERLGSFQHSEPVERQLANQEVVRGEVCAPVEIRIAGFRPVFDKAIFLDVETDGDEKREPLLGYVVLEQAQATVDMFGHRLVPVRSIAMK